MLKKASDLQVEFTQFWIKKQCPKISDFITGSGRDIIWILAKGVNRSIFLIFMHHSSHFCPL